MTLPQADPQAVTAAYQQQTAALRTQLEAFVAALWLSLPDWRNGSMRDFAGQAVPVVNGAMGHMQALTTAYLAAMSELNGGSAAPVAVKTLDVAAVRGGVSAAQVYGRPFHLVWRMLGDGKPLDVAVKAGEARAVQLAATDAQLAKTHTAKAAMARNRKIVGYRRVLEGPASCALCIVASTRAYHKAELLPIHPACVPGDARVSARGVVAVSRRWYSGELSVITTAAGDQVRVTANHPVLTDLGWLPAQFVREGDRIFRSAASERLIRSGPSEQDAPTVAENVWRSASMTFGLVQMPLSAEDFHGDGPEGEVDVIYADGNLAAVGDVHFVQPGRERLLVPGHLRGGSLDALGMVGAGLPGHLSAPVGIVRRLDLREALFGGHFAGPDQASGAAITRFDAPLQEFSLQSAAAYASRGRDLISRLAGQVETDRVIEKRGVGFSGHVYNLHTEEGWYSTGSHIVSNCDCGVDPLFEGNKEIILDPSLLEAAHATVSDTFGADSSAAQRIEGAFKGNGDPLLYRDILVTHAHGELGPILGIRGQSWTGPGDLAA